MKKKQPQKIIMKFGGTSVGSPGAVKRVISLVSSSKEPVAGVVVSAFADVTNQLIMAARLASNGSKEYNKIFLEIADRHIETVHELISHSKIQKDTLEQVELMLEELESVLQGVYLIKESSPKIMDTILSYGERLSAYIIAQSFFDSGIKANYVDTRHLVKTDDSFGSARVLLEQTYKNISIYFAKSKQTIHIITGFLGSTVHDETTTIGRGGSDYTASLFGAALHVSKIEIWTDVDGVMTADPGKVSSAFSIPQMTYKEAMEMSHFGAKVIYPQTMIPAYTHKIPLVIRNTFNPSFVGTIISHETSNGYLIKGISSIENVTLVLVQGSGMRGTPGIAARLFTALARRNISIILITQASSEYTICFAIDPKDTLSAREAVEEEFIHEMRDGYIDPPIIKEQLSIIAVIGEQMRKTLGISGKLFTTLGSANVNINAIAQGSSERNISFVVGQKDEKKAVNAIHQAFFNGKDPKQIHVYLVGTGLIGSTLLEQINALKLIVQQENITLKVVGIANTKNMLFNQQGINLVSWKSALKEEGTTTSLSRFMQTIIKDPQANAIFVDCTTSDEIAQWYPKLLSATISVVTPNKKANSGSLTHYHAIRDAAHKTHAFFLYETNVCAGLPIVKRIHDLVATGDEIVTIEGVLSGTLSYIFNNFVGDKKFSEVVKEAQREGYTEPDPRDDLNGMDVGRKLLILAREIGLPLKLQDIAIENLVPQSCRNAKNVDDFFTKLVHEDDYFEKLKKQALREKKKLVYIGQIDVKNKTFACKLEMVDAHHPCYSLSGSDNIVSVTTKRYNKTPMVIKGPGAGAEVTADGVLSDIITVGKYYAYEK